MPAVTQTSAPAWMIQHRSYRRPTPSWSWRTGGVPHCICSNFFLKKLSLILSIWGPNVYFQGKPQQAIHWIHAIDLHRGLWRYSPRLTSATFTGWRLAIVVHCFLSDDSRGYSPVHTYSKTLALQCTFWPVQAHFHLLMQLCYQLCSVTTLNTAQALLLGKICDWPPHKQCRKKFIYFP